MKDKNIVLKKGDQIKFLDYVIKNSLNNDGLVLYHKSRVGYQCHLGNFGEGTQENIDTAKKWAVVFFMIARPEKFATSLVYKIFGGGGTYHEYYSLFHALKNEEIEMPKEITCGDGMNCMIYFKGQSLGILKGAVAEEARHIQIKEQEEVIVNLELTLENSRKRLMDLQLNLI